MSITPANTYVEKQCVEFWVADCHVYLALHVEKSVIAENHIPFTATQGYDITPIISVGGGVWMCCHI